MGDVRNLTILYHQNEKNNKAQEGHCAKDTDN